MDDYLRRRDHSIETAVKVWLKDPNTILVYEGQDDGGASPGRAGDADLAAERVHHDPDGRADASAAARTFQWRDPLYKDKNTDAEEYDDYHTIEGFPTPFSITRLKNDEIVRQYYVTKVEYNRPLPDDFWNVDTAAQKIKK